MALSGATTPAIGRERVHDGSGRIVVQNLTKQFGPVTAVQNLSFTVEPGSVTGFLGPNGAGKTTTLRMLLGLVTPTAGTSLINGRPFNQLGNPARVVGAVLEAQGFHPKRTARNHLRVYAAAIGVPDAAADHVLNLVGLGAAGDRKAGGFSLGMKQRLALATALLGDPQVLVLDEPANGLDPEGIAWLRTFLQTYARSGRTVLISSHLLAEIEQTVDQVVIISRGQTMYYGGLDQLRGSQRSRVLVQPSDAAALVAALQADGVTGIEQVPDGRLAISGIEAKQVADTALKAGVSIYGIQEEKVDLEQLFFQLTNGQYAAAGANPFAAPPQQSGYYAPPAGYQQAGFQPGYQQPGYQQTGYQQVPGTPPQGYQQPGTPPQGYAPQGYQQGYAPPGTPPQGYEQPGTPPQGYEQQPQAQDPPPPGHQQPGQGGYGGGV
jgi:ABC-2 type transport system ATP-binding protein